MRKSGRLILVLFILSLHPIMAKASLGVTYHGRLLNPAGQPVRANNVQFRVQLRTSNPTNCLMYEEVQTKDLSSTAGVFALTIGDGSATQINTEPFTLEQVFRNQGTLQFGPGKCVGSDTLILNPTDSRQIVVSFNDGQFAGWEPLPAQQINFVPTAVESLTVGGHSPQNFFRVVDANGVPQVLGAWSIANYSRLTGLLAGTENIDGSAGGFTGSLSGDVTGTQSATSVVRLQGRPLGSGTPASGQVLKWDGSAWVPAADESGGAPSGNAGGDLSGTFPNPSIANNAVTGTKIADGSIGAAKLAAGSSDGQVLRYNGTTWVTTQLNYRDLVNSMSASPWPASCGAGQFVTWVSGVDAFTCVSLTSTMVANALGFTPLDPANNLSELLNPTAARTNLGLGAAATRGVGVATGNVVEVDGTGKIATSLLPNGVISSGSAAGGDLTGTYPNPTLAVGVVGTPELVDGSVTTAKVGNSQITDSKIDSISVSKITSGPGLYLTYAPNNIACTAGQVLKWTALNRWECGTDNDTSTVETDPTVQAYAKSAPGADFSTPANVLTLNTVSIAKGGTGATTAAGAINSLLPNQAAHAGKVLQTDGTNVSWQNASTGSVTSVDVSVPAYMSSTGGAITTSGTIALGFSSQAQNLIFAAPLSGAGAPSFRALNIEDLKSSVAGDFFAATGACSAGESLSYNSVTDSMACAAFSLTSGQVTTALGFTPLNAASNLSDVASIPTARTNLGLGTAATKDFGTAAGNLVELNGSARIPSSLLDSDIVRNAGATVSFQSGLDASKPAAGTVGRVYISTDTQQIYRDNGTVWVLVGTGTAGGGTVTNVATGTGLTGGPITGTGTISIAAGGVSATELATDAVTVTKIADGAVTNAKISNISINKISSGAGLYLTYAPNNVVCTVGQTLKWTALNRWECAADSNAGGTVTSVTATAPLSVANGTTTPNISLSNGTVTGQMMRWSGTAWQASTDGSDLTALNASNLSSGTLPTARLPATAVLNGGNTVSATMNVGTNSSHHLNLETAGSPRLSILADGRVGIGTTSPVYPLDVVGSITATSGSAQFRSVRTSDSTQANYYGGYNQDGSLAYLMGYDASNNDLGLVNYKVGSTRLSNLAGNLTLASSGNVGIGTGSPQRKLEVSDNGDVWMRVASTHATYPSVIDMGAVSSNARVEAQLQFSSQLGFFDKDSGLANRMMIKPDGSVGIGTSTPLGRLHVDGGNVIASSIGYPSLYVVNTAKASVSFGRTWGWMNYGDGFYLNAYASTAASVAPGGPVLAMFVQDGTGNVGIGTAAPATELSVVGSVTATGYVGAGCEANCEVSGGYSIMYPTQAAISTFGWSTTSDQRLKKEIEPLESPLENLLKIRGVRYFWKDQSIHKKREIGVLAQEVQAVFPEAVHKTQDGYLTVDYARLVSPLIEAVREQQTQISSIDARCEMSESQQTALAARVQTNERDIASLKEENQRLKSQVDAMKAYLCEKDPSAPICR